MNEIIPAIGNQDLTFKPMNFWYPSRSLQETEYINICIWYDFTLKPMKGHNGNCRWKFDGQIWRHL
jgi:hypothetical protein